MVSNLLVVLCGQVDAQPVINTGSLYQCHFFHTEVRGESMSKRKAFLLRLPPELLEELNRWAADDLRSLNGQIEFLLRNALRKNRMTKREREEAKEE